MASPELAPGGLPVDEEGRAGRDRVGGRGPVAAALLTDDEQEAHAVLAARAAAPRGDLGGQGALRVAGAAAVEAAAFDPAREEGRHAVDVGREHDDRLPGRRKRGG